MIVVERNGGTQSVSGTHNLGAITEPGLYEFGIDLTNIADGDEIYAQIDIIPRSGGSYTQACPRAYFANGQQQDAVLLGRVESAFGCRLTLVKVGGTSRNVDWFLREVLDDAVLRKNTAQAGAAGTVTLDASASASDDYYNGCVVEIVAGTGAGQARLVTDYVGSTKVATISPNWVTNPASGSVFAVRASGPSDVEMWRGSSTQPNALQSGRVDSYVGAMAAAVIASGVHAAAELNNIADTLLKRDWTAVTGEASRSALNALRFLRNRWRINSGTLTVYKEDDSTSAWTGAATSSSSNPITEVDPT